MSANLTPDQKFEMLKDAYSEQRKEIAFWRERSWKVTTWLIASMLAVASASVFLHARYPVLVPPLIGLSVVATIYLNKNYHVYSERWQLLAAVEDALGFFERDFYVQGRSLYPAKKKTPQVTYKGTAFFIASIWIVAGCTALAILVKK